jgi:hypothetical protein
MCTSRHSKTPRPFWIAPSRSSRGARSLSFFSGGEPTLSPYYLDAVAYAKKTGFLSDPRGHERDSVRRRHRVLQSREGRWPTRRLSAIRRRWRREEQTSGRGEPVRRQAAGDRESRQRRYQSHAGRNDRQQHYNDAIGQIVEFAAKNIDKIQTIAFQPVSFTGRDEDISDEMRTKWRYTLAE